MQKERLIFLLLLGIIVSIVAACTSFTEVDTGHATATEENSATVLAIDREAESKLILFPSDLITFISGSSPGGSIDIYGRALASTMPKYLPGPGGITMEFVLDPAGLRAPQYLWNAEPDGYSIQGMFLTSMVTRELMHPDVEWSMVEFTPLGGIAQLTQVLVVPANSPYQTTYDLIEAERLTMGTLLGSASHIAGMIFAEKFGIEVSYVGYEGFNEVLVALMRGDVDMAFHFSVNVAPFEESGELKSLSYLSRTKDPLYPNPDLPSSEDVGLDFLEPYATNTFAIFGPPEMPEEITSLLINAIHKTVVDEDLIGWAEKSNRPLWWIPPDQISRDIEAIFEALEPHKEILR
jgi:tripartite-type tricarboxylate transporter receptor subunit TctC